MMWKERLSAAFIGAVLLAGCMPEEGPDQVRIRKEVDQRVTKYIALKRRKCIDGIVKEVEAAVDSTLLYRAMERQNTKVPIPIPGERPKKPEIVFPANKPVRK